jgi:DNA-binding IclR family transcriptional regulator
VVGVERPGERAQSQRADGKGILGTVRNATVLLELLARGPAFQSTTSLAEQSGLSVATAHRVLRSLAEAGLVRQSGRSQGYGLGLGLVRLSEKLLSELPVVRSLSPFLVDLRNLTRATIEICLLVDGAVIAVDRVDGPSEAGVFRASRRLRPPADSAAGRLLIAHANPELQKQYAALLEVDHDQWAEWAAAPYVALRSGHGDLQVAVPVLDNKGKIAAALSATADGISEDESSHSVTTLARHLTRAAETVQGAVADE